jgi:F420H(2)-dependent quinone reductase
MTRRPRSRFWMTNRAVNPILVPILTAPIGRRLGTKLTVLRYRGRRTGLTHQLVVQYARDGDTMWILPGDPENKRWWRNFRTVWPVDVRLTGRWHHASAVALDSVCHSSEVRSGLAAYGRVFPKAHFPAGPEDAGTPDAGTPAVRTVMVRIDLDR